MTTDRLTPKACMRRFAIRGPRSDDERATLDAYQRQHPDLSFEEFSIRDDEDLNEALLNGSYAGCVFADAGAAMDAAIVGAIDFNRFDQSTLQFRMASGGDEGLDNTLALNMTRAAADAARSRRIARSRRQTVAGAILSAVFLLAVFGLLMLDLR